MRLEQEEEELANKLKNFFSREPGYFFETIAGTGAFGVALAFRNSNAQPGEYQRIAVKGMTWGQEDIAPEKEALELLKWAEHIVTRIKISFQPGRSTRWINENTIITEYLENGTLDRFQEKLRTRYHRSRNMPNRVLWAIFFCLTRACIGMAYPPGDPSKEPKGPSDQILETIGEVSNRIRMTMEHGDMHSGNIMFADLDRNEHRRFPLLKLIDFGLANPNEFAIEENISAVGSVISELICHGRDFQQLVRDKRGDNLLDPNLDPELVKLVARCISENPHRRPSLSNLFSILRQKSQQTYPDIPEETDRYISELVQKYIFDV